MFLFVILASYLNRCWPNPSGVIEAEHVVEDVEASFECGNEVEHLQQKGENSNMRVILKTFGTALTAN